MRGLSYNPLVGLDKLRSPRFRFWFATVQLVVSTIMWPYTVLFADTGEPFWVLNLSWYAAWQGAVVMVLTADVREQQED